MGHSVENAPFGAAGGAEMAPFGKPRRMHDFTDSRSEPKNDGERQADHCTRHGMRRSVRDGDVHNPLLKVPLALLWA